MPEFSSSDQAVIEREVAVDKNRPKVDDIDVGEVFEVAKCSRWIQENGVRRVGLQFPDYLLHAAPLVSRMIKDECGQEVFILGDTSFGECCVDEVAAQHLNADSVIHFGHTCLTPAQSLPVLYIFTQRHIDVPQFIQSIRGKFEETDNLLIIYDVEYTHICQKFELPDWTGNVCIGHPAPNNCDKKVDNPSLSKSSGESEQWPTEDLTIVNQLSEKLSSSLKSEELNNSGEQLKGKRTFSNSYEENVKSGVHKFGRKFAGVNSWDEVEGAKVIYICSREDSVKLMNFLFSFSSHQLFVYDGDRGLLSPAHRSASKLLMKRYFLIEKTKDAERIGILVGTLGTANYSDIIQRLRDRIRGAGKRCYTFLVGKPNVAKLANFPEIDVFVLVACPETSFPDTSDFFQPVITPYELDLACNAGREWGGQYFTDYRDLLPGAPGFVAADDNAEFEPDVSLVSGRVRGGGTNGVDDEHGELAVINDRTVGLLHAGGGGEFLASRSWSGLQQQLGETEVKPTVQGQIGIAAGYTDYVQDNS